MLGNQMEGIPPKKDPKDLKNLLGAESAEQIWAGFWEGENGLKHRGEIAGVEYDRPAKFGFEDYNHLEIGHNVINEFTKAVRDGLGSFLMEIHRDGGPKVAKYIEDLAMRTEGEEVWMRGSVGFDASKIDRLWNGESGRDELEQNLDYMRRDLLKGFTLWAIMEDCGSFEECSDLYSQWKEMEGFSIFVNTHILTAWMNKAKSWEEKREVILAYREVGTPYGNEYIEAILSGADSLEEQKVMVKQLLDDEEVGGGFKNPSFFYAWLKMETTSKGKGEILMIQTGDYGLDFTSHNALAMMLNLDSFKDFEHVFHYLATNEGTAAVVQSCAFMYTLLNNDCFTFRQKFKIIDLYKGYKVMPNRECLEAIWESIHDLDVLRGGLSKICDKYRTIGEKVPEELVQMLLSLTPYGEIDEFRKTCDVLKANGLTITEEVVRGLVLSDGVAMSILNEEDFDNWFPVMKVYVVMEVVSDTWFHGDYPGPRIVEIVKGLPKAEKEILRRRLEQFFVKNDVKINGEYIHYCLGDEVEFDVYPMSDDEEPMLNRNFAPWLDFYGLVCDRDLDFYESGANVAVEDNLPFDRDVMRMFRGMASKFVPKLRVAISELVDAELAQVARSEDPGVDALDRHLKRMAQKKKAKKKKKKGRK